MSPSSLRRRLDPDFERQPRGRGHINQGIQGELGEFSAQQIVTLDEAIRMLTLEATPPDLAQG